MMKQFTNLMFQGSFMVLRKINLQCYFSNNIKFWPKYFSGAPNSPKYLQNKFSFNFAQTTFLHTISFETSIPVFHNSQVRHYTGFSGNYEIPLLERKSKCKFLNKNSLNDNYLTCNNNLNDIRSFSSKRINIDKIPTRILSKKSKKRIQKRKISVEEPSELDFQTFACATADEYDLEQMAEAFHKQGLYIETSIVQETPNDDSVSPSKLSNPDDVIHLCAAYQVTPEPRTMYVFREGVIVFWNMPALERKNILQFVKKFQDEKYEEDIVEEEAETLIYTYTDTSTRLKSSQNLILLNEKGEKDLEKFTFSNALAMSVKLGICEASLDRYVESIEHVTEELSKSGVVVLKQEQVLQRMGQLFALRHLINLSSDLLDTPDFYWEHETLGQLYNKTANHLSLHKRTSVMNTKLNDCLELMELLKSHLNERHSSRLEWIIIILIMIEVFFEILHFI